MNSPTDKHGARSSSIASPLPLERPTARNSSLLPAFEPLSSPLPRTLKRKHVEDAMALPKLELKYYPTPVPTSSTGLLPSSPPRRPGLERTLSTLSERTPLGSLPTVDVPLNGEPVLMGRSSNSSNYQLSTNRLISRVHVSAVYRAPSPQHPSGQIEIECLGYNGVTVHCEGRVRQLSKGEQFVSDMPSAEIMLDVHDSRVIVAWPEVDEKTEIFMPSSPPEPLRLRSPESPSPANQTFVDSTTLLEAESTSSVQIYEDRDSAEPVQQNSVPGYEPPRSPIASIEPAKASKESLVSSLEEYSDQDEENDPIIHSFYGENILPRFAAFATGSPQRPRKKRRPLEANSPSPQQRSKTKHANESPIKNHVINQLAFSRVHSMPLSTIIGNLPADLKGGASSTCTTESSSTQTSTDNIGELTNDDLERILHDIPCIGEIQRKGKDAAGKPLQNEFYYLPDFDANTERRDNVVNGMGGAGLRTVRKNHKVRLYFKYIYLHELGDVLMRLLIAILLEEASKLRPCIDCSLPIPFLCRLMTHTYV